MVGHEDSGASKKKSTDSSNDLPTFNAENLQNNTKIIYYSRTFLSIIGGVIAGILGYTGLTGFVFYFLIMAITSLGLAAKAKFSIHSYFDCWNRLLLDGFLGGLLVIFLPMDEAPGGVQMENEDFLMGHTFCSGLLHMTLSIYSEGASAIERNHTL
ncbi:PREDICTED: ER membrane protein complex subunit 6-like isoform X1 [Nelumbo nucifera]|uniref:ER membrane protein complex subunit 6 n=1 Tax=Nelumbo nucifera TaxID=4432 RepID=A0A1U8Q714_NELNU|nr:PREDICTED: ER membrane protein complex subunit 6-like isoform X2 [Nelumbo nucifera]XP_019053865.1 PREDICTED: ER membrane protein complex subunit 6-like isoform X1 [Nelumbo nucifera]